MSRVLDAITGQPWAITQEWLNTIVGIASREISDLEAVRAKAGEPMNDSRGMVRRGKAGVISVTGPIFRRANLFARISGATSIELLARDFTAALDDPTIEAILLDIDSPGGEVNGVNEFAEMIYAARGRKPIVAYVGHMAASAAYWIAAAADTMVIDATAMVGSIGVVMAMPSERPSGEMEFTSSQSPNKRPDVAGSEGRRQIQDLIDATAEVFIGAVAKYRGVSPKTVESDFGRGGMLVGEAAVKAGMADRIGSLEGLIAAYDLPADLARAQQRARRAADIADAAAQQRAAYTGATQQLAALSDLPPDAADAAAGVPHMPPSDLDPDITQENIMPNEPIAGETPDAPALPPLPSVPSVPSDDPIVAQQVAAYAAQIQAQFRAQHEAVLQQAQAQALAQFERWKADQAAQQAILTFAQHVTTPTLDRPHALAYTAEQVSELLSGLSGDKRKAVQQLLTDAVDGTLIVAHDRIGNSAGEQGESDAQRWSAVVADYQAQGMSKAAAIQAAMRSHRDLYTAQTQQKKGGK